MSYIGNTPITQGFTPAVDYFSGNGSTTAFTLSRPVASVAQIEVLVNNVAQNPSTAYTVSNNTLTFTGAPSTGTNNIYVRYTSPISQVIQPGQGTVNTAQLVDASVTTAKIPDANITQGKFATNVAGNGPAFSAFRTGSEQAITSGVWTKVQLNTENFDTANCFDNTTNYRFTPTAAGYYQVNFAVYGSAGTYTGVLAALYKNGVPYLNSSNYATSAALDDWSVSGSVLLFMNGLTDYIELYAYLVGTASIGNNTYTHMDAYLARSA